MNGAHEVQRGEGFGEAVDLGFDLHGDAFGGGEFAGEENDGEVAKTLGAADGLGEFKSAAGGGGFSVEDEEIGLGVADGLEGGHGLIDGFDFVAFEGRPQDLAGEGLMTGDEDALSRHRGA